MKKPFECFPIWVIYNKPSDYPDAYVARKFLIRSQDDKTGTPTDEIILANSLKEIRQRMAQKRLIVIPRFYNDDPVIIETWL